MARTLRIIFFRFLFVANPFSIKKNTRLDLCIYYAPTDIRGVRRLVIAPQPSLIPSYKTKQNKSSTVAEWATVGVATTNIGRKEGGAAAPFAESWDPV